MGARRSNGRGGIQPGAMAFPWFGVQGEAYVSAEASVGKSAVSAWCISLFPLS